MKFSIPENGVPQIEGASWIQAEGNGLPHRVFVRLETTEDQRLVASGLLIEVEPGNELTTRDTRVPLARIVAEFNAAASRPATYKRLRRQLFGIKTESEAEDAWQPEAGGWLAADFVAVSARKRPVRRQSPGRRGLPEDHYKTVADAYKRAKRQHPRSPIKAVMSELHAAEPTVHRWLRTARERGYLEKRPGDVRASRGMDTED
jgi:Transposase C of IS166 homeodomain